METAASYAAWYQRVRWAVYTINAVPTGGAVLKLNGVAATLGPQCFLTTAL